jgi:hypothetical protein
MEVNAAIKAATPQTGRRYSGRHNNVPLFGRYFVAITNAVVLIFGTYLWQTV